MRHLTCNFVLLGLLAGAAGAQELSSLQLPEPRRTGGMPLMQALAARASTRAYREQALTMQQISDLLWAAAGYNRADKKKRTAPSAANWQEIDLYVATGRGLYLYQPARHFLKAVLDEDIRSMTGTQEYFNEAPVELIYVADYDRMKSVSPGEREFFSAADAAFMCQNVYLYCASEGLGAVVRAVINRPALHRRMNLRPHQQVVLAQTVGYPSAP